MPYVHFLHLLPRRAVVQKFFLDEVSSFEKQEKVGRIFGCAESLERRIHNP